jgi:[acyl-carrier-protein] S-malonyltransferase
MSIAFVFPGQGSQQPGMGQFLYNEFAVAKRTFEEASEALNLDLKKLCFEGSEADLALTENTQPALLTTSVATLRVIEEKFKLNPAVMAGHSIGEYAALVGAGAIDFAPAVKAVRIRGQAMQSAVPVGQGGMAAIMGLENSQVQALCNIVVEKSGHSPLSPANFNSPGQVVISGNQKAIDWLRTEFKPEMLGTEVRRLKIIPLTVSAPFHCAMMLPAEQRMRAVLTEMKFRDAAVPVIQNYTAKPETTAVNLRENLIKQVSAPVLWTQSVLAIKAMGVSKALELGTGKVLAGLIKKIDSEGQLQVFGFNSLEDINAFEASLKS